MDLIVLVSYYSLVSRVVKALDVEMDDGVQAECLRGQRKEPLDQS